MTGVPTDLLSGLLADLAAESDLLARAVDDLGEQGWRRPTPAVGWDVATTIAHLAWTDRAALVAGGAVTGGESGMHAWDTLVAAALTDPDGFVDRAALDLAAQARADVLATWADGRRRLVAALAAFPAGERLPWFGPPMSPASMATARLMETWAHAQDVQAAAGTSPEPTDRIRAIAHLGVRTRDFAFATRGEMPPAEEFRVELRAPSGELWTWGEPQALQRVSGSASDFCRLVTQRVHRGDTDLVATGAQADHWLDIAQAFAGPPGPGRERSGG